MIPRQASITCNTNYISDYKFKSIKSLNYEIKAFNEICESDRGARNSLVFQY